MPRFLLRRCRLLLAAPLLAGGICAGALAEQPAPSVAAAAIPIAPGYGALEYSLPEPGSYRLPPLGRAADGAVLDGDGRQRSLHQLFGGKYVLLNFMYSHCSDVNGCPLSAHVYYQIKTAMQDDPWLAENLRLVSLSFDPERDTPQVMRLYGNNFKYAGKAGDWDFLTTESPAALRPLLAAYDQDVQAQYSTSGIAQQEYAHVLRVFLIDPELRIRNIYSVAFLHRDVLLNDINTLRAAAADETLQAGGTRLASRDLSADMLPGPGDDKRGYAGADYTTRSRALELRRGAPADLLGLAQNPPLGLPPLPLPADKPLSAERIALGRRLFYDRRLSLNDTVSCAMCHIPEQGFSNNEIATAVGFEGRSVRRNSPTIYNVGYLRRLFHDGREENLEQQVWAPLLARNEMANPSVGAVLGKLRRLPDYAGLFEAAFDGRGPGMETVGMALAAYQRALLSADSPFDRYRYGGDADALSDSARRGLQLFSGRAGCAACHSIGADHALFTDQRLYNTGIGYQRAMGDGAKTRRVQLAPGVFVDMDVAQIEAVGEPPPADVGLYEITQNPDDRWKYRTPSLRNVALSAPYMHDGSLATLRQVIEFYNRGGTPNPLLDPRIRPLGLDDAEIDDLLAFLESLTGSNVGALVADAFAAPIGDISTDDPHWAHRERADQ